MRRHALPFLLGVVSGALGGLMGVGGGIILVPLLIHALHRSQHEAQGVSLAFVVVTAFVAAVPYYGHERLDLPLALFLTLGALPGVIAGSRVAAATPAARLRIAFGLILLITAARLLAAPPLEADAVRPWPVHANLLLGLGIGVLAGLLGVGGGTLLVPILVLGQGIGQHTAQGISLLVIVPVGIVGVLSYARRSQRVAADLPPLLAGGAAGALAGALLAHRVEAPTLSRIFALFLLVVAAQMIFRRPRGTLVRSTGPSGGTP